MYTQIINNVKRFIELNDDELYFFTSLLSTKKYKRKDMILRNGEVSNYELFIVNGCVKNYTIDNNGFEHISMFAIEDWWTGDIASFTSATPSIFNIEALEDTEVLQISKANLDLLLDKVPKFEKFFRILYERSLIAYIERNNQNISFTAEQRYLTFIKKYPKFELRVSQKNIAAYLGITPEFLSLLRKKLNS